jgi:indolepyruvate ferredoxin oxidoreductase
MRFLRGTAVDPFAHSQDRKLDRELLAEYEGVINEFLGLLRPENHAIVVEIAAYPEAVRGYGHVRERHAEHARRRKSELFAELRGKAEPPPRHDDVAEQERANIIMAG